MQLTERHIPIPISPKNRNMLEHIRNSLGSSLNAGDTAVRFAITHIDEDHYHCEFGVLEGLDQSISRELPSIFDGGPRRLECTDAFNIVFVVPTGIGAVVGGHAGDATPVARVLAEVCDILTTHPNVVNASDINEMPQNALYV